MAQTSFNCSTSGSKEAGQDRCARRPRGRPRDEALQERRREEILQAAADAFAVQGYPNTDVQVIAAALGVARGTVYRYFPSKELLFLAAVERGVRQLQEHIGRAVEPVEDPIRRIGVAVVAYLEFFALHPQLVELFIQERAEFRGRKKTIYFEQRDAKHCQWHDEIASLIRCGRLRSVPVERVMTVLGDLMYGTMFTNHFAGRNQPFARQAADIVDVVFHGILGPAERNGSA